MYAFFLNPIFSSNSFFVGQFILGSIKKAINSLIIYDKKLQRNMQLFTVLKNIKKICWILCENIPLNPILNVVLLSESKTKIIKHHQPSVIINDS